MDIDIDNGIDMKCNRRSQDHDEIEWIGIITDTRIA